jgi:hypothetical protein
MMSRYNIALTDTDRVRALLSQLAEELLSKERVITDIVMKIRTRLNRLDEISMRPGHMTDSEYIKALIQSEKTSMKSG